MSKQKPNKNPLTNNKGNDIVQTTQVEETEEQIDPNVFVWKDGTRHTDPEYEPDDPKSFNQLIINSYVPECYR